MLTQHSPGLWTIIRQHARSTEECPHGISRIITLQQELIGTAKEGSDGTVSRSVQRNPG